MKTIDDINFNGKRALIRLDFNVPLDKSFTVTDDNRIRATIPTLKKILNEEQLKKMQEMRKHMPRKRRVLS